jgi:hypothetical protein
MTTAKSMTTARLCAPGANVPGRLALESMAVGDLVVENPFRGL